MQTRLEAFAETIFIDLECFTNSLEKAVTETIHVYNVLRKYQKHFTKKAIKQSAKRNEINNKRFAEVLKSKSQTRYEIRTNVSRKC